MSSRTIHRRIAAAAVVAASLAGAAPAAADSTVSWRFPFFTDRHPTGFTALARVDSDQRSGEIIAQAFRSQTLSEANLAFSEEGPSGLSGPGWFDAEWVTEPSMRFVPDTPYYVRFCFDQTGAEPITCGFAREVRTTIPTTHEVISSNDGMWYHDGTVDLSLVGLLDPVHARGTFVFELGPTQSYGTRIEIPIAKPEHRIHYKYVSKFVQPASPSGHWRACFEWTQGDGTQGRRCGVDRTYTTSLPACDDLNTEGIVGTDGPERLDGTDGAERIQAMAGNDTILAGDGRDCIEAGGGSDKIYAGRGDDRIEAEDDVQEMVDCGGGTRDVAIVDSIDSTRGCEVVAAG